MKDARRLVAPWWVVAMLIARVGVAWGAAPVVLPQRLEAGKTYPVRGSASNSGVRVEIVNASLSRAYGAAAAPAGRSFLIVDMRWENTFPLTQVNNKQLSTEYVVPALHDHLYAVCGSHALRLAEGSGKWPGCLPDEGFRLSRFGSVLRGNAVFDMPVGLPAELIELRFYDFAHGHFSAALTNPSRPSEAPKPLAPALVNDVIEAAVFGAGKSPDLGGLHAPDGMNFVLIDLRARSVLTTDADAAAFDPKARPGAKIKVGTVADWTEARKYAQLVADGEYGYLPLPQSDLPKAPRFLPDVLTGGTLAFLVPAECKSLELRCDFPNARLPDGKVIRPKGLALAVKGKRPAAAAMKSIASAKDQVFDVSLLGQRVVPGFGGAKAEDGRRIYVLDVRVKNLNTQQEFFQPKEQLKFVTAAGEQVEYDDVSYAGVHPPTEQVYIPAAETRRFELAYRVGANETRPRIAYASVTQGASKVLTLPELPNEAVAAAKTPTPETPAPPPPTTPPPPAAVTGEPPKVNEPAMARAPEPKLVEPQPQVNREPPPAVPAPKQHGPAKGIEGVGLTAEQVNAAIDKGMNGLWKLILDKDLTERGIQFGDDRQHVLAALALVHANGHKKIPAFNAALRGYLARVEPHTLQTYDNGILCMLIEAYGDPVFHGKMKESARWLIEAQGEGGTWDYSPPIPEAVFAAQKPTGALQVSGGTPPGQRDKEWTRLTDWKTGQDGDNSVTQFAILGLQAASRGGIPVPAETWKRALAAARDRQAEDGGWAYHDHEATGYGAMTSAGICAVAICRDRLGEKDPTRDPAVARGVAWLDKVFAVDKHVEKGDPDDWAYYFLYSIERVGRTLDDEFIGDHEWYPLGARYLVDSQQPDGLWSGHGGQEKDDPRLPASFALLFLTRATPPLKPAAKHGPGTLITDAVAPDNRFYVILDASGSMLDNMDGRMKFDIARGAVQAMIDALPPNSQVALRVYGHRKSALDEGCDEDTELKIPMGPLDKKQFTGTLNSLRSRGKTPMAMSIQDAIADLGEVADDKPVTLLLLTDGGEDTIRPRGNPVKACEELAKVKNVRFHIVGFDINQPDWSQQLQAMAQASGGRYWPAARAADLERSVRNAVLGIPEQFVVLGADGRQVKAGQFGDSVSLPEGQYKFRTLFAGRPFEQELYISPGENTAVTFDASQVPPGAAASEQSPAAAAPAAAAPPATETPKAWPKFCTHCGAPLKPGQKFCTTCGTPVQPK